MKQAITPASRRSPGSTVFSMTPVAAACSALLFATAAHAQEAAQAEPVSVVVTGIRGSIETSIAAKKNAEGVTEVVTAEDIGKLPDVSIAESLARLPGLAGQRVQGRAQVIAIRGMSPDFAGTLLNGREQVTTGDNRGVEFDQFPSELIHSATVYKTPDAGLIGQGLSGTIDMRVVRPLDLRERKVALNARGEYNSNGKLNQDSSAKGKRLSASYIDQFANNTIGVAVGYAHLDSPGQAEQYKAWGFEPAGPDNFCQQHEFDWGCSPATGVPDGAVFQQGFEISARSRNQKRDGVMGVLEFKPHARFHSTFDVYYSQFDNEETSRGLMGGLGGGWGGIPGAAYSNVKLTPVGNGQLVTAADIRAEGLLVRNDLNTRDDSMRSLGWNTRIKLADKWSAIADLSYSNAKRQEHVIESYAGVAGPVDLSIQLPTGSGFPVITTRGLNYADASTVRLMDPAGWGHDALWKKPRVDDTIKALRLEARREFDGMFSSLDVGVNFSKREKAREMNEFTANLKNDRAPVLVPASLLVSPTPLSFAGMPGGVLSYRLMDTLNALYDIAPTAEYEIIHRNYEVSEKVATAYAKLNLDTDIGTVRMFGNAGLQFVRTEQSSHGFSWMGTTLSETTRGAEYSNMLPSLNLNFDFGNDQYVRVGAARTMARGRIDDMKAGNDVSVDPTSKTWSGYGGNPQLKPWLANSFDVSYEKYFGKGSYVAVAGFHKKLLNYIYEREAEYDFTGVPNPSGIQPASPIGLFWRPENGQGGNVRGIELSGALDAGSVVSALAGFGVQASASYTESNLRPMGPDQPTKLAGLSGTVAGLTVYYEKDGFSARVGQRYRSAFRGEISGLHYARSFTEISAERQTDLQLGYEFGAGRMKGLSILLQVNNLTNSPYATVNGTANGVLAPEAYEKYGRQYLLGLNYKL
ncbi:TonB-dependent receptor [Pseudoduganella sp. GCM10020061]|uniref:TonB-dependent receptor n=1 Tax=Pseudoduganella sp. GCM10020061 TaxID=3317345 RepID=UPI00363BC74B